MAHGKVAARIALAIGIIGVVLAGTATFYPAIAAIACSSCYGFERLEENVYIERGVELGTRASVKGTVDEARLRVKAFYGELLSEPKVMICVTDTCYRAVGGGGSRGMAILDRALFLSSRGTTIVIASHELAHVELHHRLGLIDTLRRVVPQWFDEGLAVTISNDPRYLGPPTRADRCLIRSDEPLPNDRRAWVETAATHDLYAKAACRVVGWLNARNGAEGVKRLVSQMREGQTFETATQ